jgi:hypothetical protein
MVRDWCPLSVTSAGYMFIHDSCYGWNIFLQLGTQKLLKGSKALETVSAIITGTGGSIGKFDDSFMVLSNTFLMPFH